MTRSAFLGVDTTPGTLDSMGGSMPEVVTARDIARRERARTGALTSGPGHRIGAYRSRSAGADPT